ncbi:TRAP transporter substrate-binding protein [Shewanella psychropiezotolerans]|uniref:TRAP transporter substrate-binding protein n=1 Tax=Shewanella psychropiezotolerans TaxID=2593655 RepID=A0ABX5WX57_9GAMM|nr:MULTISPECIES: TRAP transporter substrate-binding protein [Shewanella]MPY24802.1 TRAP transporter substrate-binding protein [Shewanella sp. YLB-07]QDO83553.1 TRAP transporter substrate-binding protein [Shewanella psychropiezotolerans]
MTSQSSAKLQPLKILSTLITVASLLTSSIHALAAPVEIKFSHVVAKNTPKGQMALKFKELVEQRLPGEYQVNVFPNSQLFGDNNEISALLLNDIQFVAPSLSKFERYTKKLQLFDLPFLFENMDSVDRFQQSDAGLKLLNAMKRKGIVGLGYLHNGMKQFSASSPLVVPADARGKKFRIMASDVLAAQFLTLDAIPVKKPFSEVFTLLQTRAIDGQENTWSNIYSKKFFEVQGYITESNHGVLDYMVVTSNTFWKSLPDDKREIIKSSLDEAIAFGNQIAAAKVKKDRESIITSKRSKVIELTPEQRNLWVESMRPVWSQFEAKIGKDLIQAAVESNKQ